jgi:sodium-dependent dicarboxylate transporter 2/3/5
MNDSLGGDTFRRVAMLAGPLAAAGTWAWALASGGTTAVALVGALTVLVALWWIFEPVPIPFTSMLPLAVLPVAGVLTAAEVAQAYGNPIILLLLGGFMLSQALTKSGVHRRLALGMLSLVGGRGGRSLVFGFMLTGALLSMWISNTAACLMLLPIALATLEQSRSRRLDVAVLLGITYGTSVGGMGTPIGTPPNLIFIESYRNATGITVGFTEYMAWTLPVLLLFLPLIGLWLSRNLGRGELLVLPPQGPWRAEEVRVLGLFVLVAVAWVTRTEPFGGWSAWFDVPGASDGSIALLGCIAMAMLPDGQGGRLLDWEHAAKIPWGILLLFGGGIALAAGFENSGLTDLVAGVLGSGIAGLSIIAVVAIICLFVTFLTELTSNTATATLLMPIVGAAAIGAQMDPLPLMLATSLSASCAFMLPVATGPNAVVFGAGRMRVADMAREGLVVNFIGVLVITAVIGFLLT